VVVGGIGLLIVVLLLTRGSGQVAVPEPRDPAVPDLVTLPLFDFLVGTDNETGAQNLRFSTTIGNVGVGTLRIQALRSDGSGDDWQVIQWFDEPDGEPSGVTTGATMTFGGHGHEHWHIKFGAAYRLYPAEGEDADELASQTKAGYCFFDQVRLEPEVEGAPADRRFLPEGCGSQDSTDVSMGMSVGWSDPYYWQLEDQSVEITGLPDGRYRLVADADPDGWLQESDEENNGTWVVLEIGTLPDGLRSVAVVESAPAP
jgi:hypothetical protein